MKWFLIIVLSIPIAWRTYWFVRYHIAGYRIKKKMKMLEDLKRKIAEESEILAKHQARIAAFEKDYSDKF